MRNYVELLLWEARGPEFGHALLWQDSEAKLSADVQIFITGLQDKTLQVDYYGKCWVLLNKLSVLNMCALLGLPKGGLAGDSPTFKLYDIAGEGSPKHNRALWPTSDGRRYKKA